MNREGALNYKSRWRLVNERTTHEARAMSPAFKLEQLAQMYEAGQQLGWADGLRAGEEEVRERWRRLREFYRVRG